MGRAEDVALLRRAIGVSAEARASGNTPFGALLASPDGEVLLEQGNIEITERTCTGHAETTLMARASGLFTKAELAQTTLYTSAEPCAMCAGSIYWGGVGRVVYALSEKELLTLTGADEQNPTLDLPCREVFARGQKAIEVVGPFPELAALAASVHEGYWG
ncbi:MAG TPA: nucleoside deaminase [Propioniciclava tarda]|nr:nucleoside deaminase [Propioniciclava tarda]HQA31400.1 nucleoside deaminase [Propioniciclava tarda]HQD61160.1 nucleoside deaminase [Propioniciclava tarda]